MAEGLAKSVLGEGFEIESAGSEPSGKVQPWAVEALKEEGIDISRNYSKSYNDLSPGFLENLDFVITLCAEEICPSMTSKAKRLHWPTPDPAGVPEEEKPAAFRSAREQIKGRIEEFAREQGL